MHPVQTFRDVHGRGLPPLWFGREKIEGAQPAVRLRRALEEAVARASSEACRNDRGRSGYGPCFTSPMRWSSGNVSPNIEDRRGGGVGVKMGIGGTLVLFALSLIFGRDFLSQSGDASPREKDPNYKESPEEHQQVQFVSFVLDDTQRVWRDKLAERHVPYHDAKLVLFTDAVRSGCGGAEAAMGPFYCPLDEKVYIDLGFYRELRQRFGAPGDFAQAYVIAHEIGHHIQHVLGLDASFRERQASNPRDRNAASIALELQADCFAGVWGHSTDQRGILETGDVEEGLGAAAAVGDDRIQKTATGRVNPETWTHGSSDQRVRWFKRGLTSGRIEDCDTTR